MGLYPTSVVGAAAAKNPKLRQLYF